MIYKDLSNTKNKEGKGKRPDRNETKIADRNPIILIITLNQKGPNPPIKQQRYSNQIKKPDAKDDIVYDPTHIRCSEKTTLWGLKAD